MADLRRGLVGLAGLVGALVALTACSTPAPSTPAPAPVASSAPSSAAPPASISGSGSELSGTFNGPLARTSILDITPTNTPQAQVTVKWHKEQALTLSALLPACQQQLVDSELDDNTVLSGVVADLSTQFPSSWPAGKTLPFTYDDGRTNSTSDRAYTCYSNQNLDDPKSASQFTLTPKTPTVTIMWLRTATKTPADPTGKIDGDNPATYEIKATDTTSATCSGQYVQPGCLASYGG